MRNSTARAVHDSTAVLLALIVALAVFAGAARPLAADGVTEKGVADDGRQLAERLCSGCHIIGPAASDVPLADAPRFADIARKWPPETLAEALAEGIEVGHRGDGVKMPEFTLEPGQIENLIAYLERLRATSP